jgi:hypothetical protein
MDVCYTMAPSFCTVEIFWRCSRAESEGPNFEFGSLDLRVVENVSDSLHGQVLQSHSYWDEAVPARGDRARAQLHDCDANAIGRRRYRHSGRKNYSEDWRTHELFAPSRDAKFGYRSAVERALI